MLSWLYHLDKHFAKDKKNDLLLTCLITTVIFFEICCKVNLFIIQSISKAVLRL